MSTFFVFTPVPLRRRCDGWTPELQLRFVRLLAEGAKPGEAARLVGRNRQNAYALRKRAGAESFAAAWDEAAALGADRRRKRTASAPELPPRHIPIGRALRALAATYPAAPAPLREAQRKATTATTVHAFSVHPWAPEPYEPSAPHCRFSRGWFRAPPC